MAKISRREFLRITGAFGVGATMFSELFLHPPVWSYAAVEESFEKTMKRLFKERPIKTTEQVRLVAPTIAETGATVPVAVQVFSPMTERDFISSIYIISQKNPVPLIGKFNFSPHNGKAFISTRIKLAETGKLYAIAETNAGELFQAIREVKVTLGGCGG